MKTRIGLLVVLISPVYLTASSLQPIKPTDPAFVAAATQYRNLTSTPAYKKLLNEQQALNSKLTALQKKFYASPEMKALAARQQELQKKFQSFAKDSPYADMIVAYARAKHIALNEGWTYNSQKMEFEPPKKK